MSDVLDFTTFTPFIQGNSASVTYQNNGTTGSVVTITFPIPFAGVPKAVVATPVGSVAIGLTIHVNSITSTGFNAIGRIASGGPVNGTFQWVAVYY